MDIVVKSLLSPAIGEKSYVVVVFTGFVILVASTGVINTRRSYSKPEVVSNAAERYQQTVRSFSTFFDEVLPIQFKYETSAQSYWRQLRLSHHFCLWISDSKANPSDRRKIWIRLFVKLLAILSAHVILALLYYPISTQCSAKETSQTCAKVPAYLIVGKLCSWDQSSDQCTIADENDLFAFALFMIFVAGAVSSSTDKFMQFALSHAEVAMKSRRMAWLYWCCFPASERVVGLPQSRIALSGKMARVVPVTATRPAAGEELGPGLGEEDLERGTDASIEEGSASRPKPAAAARMTGVSALASRLLPATLLKPVAGHQRQRSATLGEVLQSQERALSLYGDDWASVQVQSRKATLLRAARLSLMRGHMDFVSAAQERHLMLQHKRERNLWMEEPDRPQRGSNWWDAAWRSFRLLQLRRFDFGDPSTALELMHLAHLQHHDLIEYSLRRSRMRATELRAQLMRQSDDFSRDRYLMRAFLVDSLCGHKRAVARAVMFEADEIAGARRDRVIWQYFALLTVPVYVIVALAIIFYGGLAVHGYAAAVWAVCAAASLVHEFAYLQPAVIWFLQVWAPGAAKKDVLAIHWVLQVRARSILSRRTGLLNSVNALAQHFHPACRASRLVPHLPIARLLLSLTDHDLPFRAVQQRPRRRDVHYPTAQVLNTGSPLVSDRCEAIGTNLYSAWRYLYNIARTCTMAVLRLALLGLYSLPAWCRELLVELACSALFIGALLVLYAATKSDTSGTLTGTLAGLMVVAIAIAVYKAYRDVRKEAAVLKKLATQRENYSLHCNPPQS